MRRLGIFLLILALSCVAFGQGTTSRITGTVSDRTGAVIAGANVTATNEGTNTSFRTTSSATGVYVFDSVQVGKYTITAEFQGFKKFVSSGNVLEIGLPTTVNATMEVGATGDVVEVQGGYELVQTSSSGNFGGAVDTKTLTQLPVVGVRGRNALDLVQLVPGVIDGNSSIGGSRCNIGGCSTVNGSRDRAWNLTLDGIDSNETSMGGTSPARVNPDAISEFRVITGQTTAEFGRNTGGQVTMVTKSGTNRLHGDAFWFYQTPAITANTAANKAATPQIKRPQFVQNIYGGDVGGPVIKNKTFFYANVQLLHALTSSTPTRTVYTDSARKGLWRYALGQRNAPAGTSGASVDISGNPIVSIATYNMVANDPAKIGLDPAVQKYIAMAPLPNNFTIGDGLNTAGFTFSAPQLEKQVDLVFKIDQVINASQTIFVRWAGGHQNTIGDTANTGAPVFPGQPSAVDTKRRPRNLAINWRWTPTAKTTNELVLGMNRFSYDFISGLDLPAGAQPFRFTNITNPLETTYSNSRFLTTYQLVDNFTLSAGAHTWRFGTNFRYGRHIDHRGGIGSLNAAPMINFSRTVNPIVDSAYNFPSTSGPNAINSNDTNLLRQGINELLGRIGQIQQGYAAQDDNTWKPAGSFNIMDHRWPEYDFYVQDTWKVRPNLTIDMGVRLEARLAPNLVSFKNLVPDQPFVFGQTPSSTLKWVPGDFYKNDWNNFGPSFGFAWDPFKDGKTSIRGNYRLGYDRINTFSFSSSVFQGLPGLTYQLTDTSLGQNGLRAKDWRVPAPPSTPASLRLLPPVSTNSITVADPNMRTPKVNMWGFSVEREVMRNTVLSLTYNGRHGVGLFGYYNANDVDITKNGFLDAWKIVAAGGTSALMDQITAPVRSSGQTSYAYIRTLESTAFAINDVAYIAGVMANRVLSNGKSQVEAAGLSPYFFRPYPQVLGGLNVLDTRDYSIYHGLSAQLQRRFSNGLLYEVGWTWSKSEDVRSVDPTSSTTMATGSGQGASSTPWDIKNPRLNWAPSDLDRTHVFLGHLVYQLPFGKGKRWASSSNGVIDRLIGGWEIATFGTWQSGRPYTIYSGTNSISATVVTPALCFGPCNPYTGGVYRDPTTHNQFFFHTTAFDSTTGCRTLTDGSKLCIPQPGQFSNIGRNYWRYPIYANLNATVSKDFRIIEGHTLQARLEMQNLTNSQMYDYLGSFGIQSTIFGRMKQDTDGVSGGPQRRVQLSLKYTF